MIQAITEQIVNTLSVEAWTQYAKLLLGLGAGLLVLSGGLFMLVWSVAQKARRQWFDLADEWAASESFRAAVTAARKDVVERMVLEMHNDIDHRIQVHNGRENVDAHRAAITHVIRNYMSGTLSAYEKHIRGLEERIQRLER